MATINWTSKFIKISDLKDYENNPRKITKDEFHHLVKSLQEDGYHSRILVNLDNTIIGGHQRKKALLKAAFKPDDEIEVLIPDRLLEGEEFDRVNIRDNLSFSSWDYSALGNNFNVEQLVEWGMPEFALLGDKPEKEERKPVEKKTKICPSCGEVLS